MATKINNVACSWSFIELKFSGGTEDQNKTLLGVSAIKYDIKRKVETNYGLGGNPINRGFGNKGYSASITMDLASAQSLLGSNTSFEELGEFDLVLTFTGNDSVTTNNHVVTFKGCFISDSGMDAKQDDTNLTREYDLHPFLIVESVSGTSES